MSKSKQGLIIAIESLVLFFLFSPVLLWLEEIIFGPPNYGLFGPVVPEWVGIFPFAFPFFFTLVEFFFYRPISDRVAYSIVMAPFLFLNIDDFVFLLVMLLIIMMGALPGLIYNWVRCGKPRFKLVVLGKAVIRTNHEK